VNQKPRLCFASAAPKLKPKDPGTTENPALASSTLSRTRGHTVLGARWPSRRTGLSRFPLCPRALLTFRRPRARAPQLRRSRTGLSRSGAGHRQYSRDRRPAPAHEQAYLFRRRTAETPRRARHRLAYFVGLANRADNAVCRTFGAARRAAPYTSVVSLVRRICRPAALSVLSSMRPSAPQHRRLGGSRTNSARLAADPVRAGQRLRRRLLVQALYLAVRWNSASGVLAAAACRVSVCIAKE